MKDSILKRDTDFLYNFLNGVLSTQFSETFASSFLEDFNQMRFKYSRNTHKIKYIYLGSQLQASYRPTLGLFSLSVECVKRIYKDIPFPQLRVQIQSDVSEFIRAGKSVFAKHTLKIDPDLKIGSQVFVVDEEDDLLAIGKLCIPPHFISHFNNGMAVDVKKGVPLS